MFSASGLCQQPVLPVQAVGVDRWVLEVQNRGRAVGVEPEDVVGIPAGEPAGRDRRTDPVTQSHLGAGCGQPRNTQALRAGAMGQHETVTGPKACRARRRPMGNRANPIISTADARLIEHHAKQFAGADCHLSGKSSGLTSSVRAVPPATGWRVIVKFCQ
jgi:hypothetical protein